VVALNLRTRFRHLGGGTYELLGGAARFHVSGASQFRVKVGEVSIEHIGTVFTVERFDDDRTLVAVHEGRVRVTWRGHARELGAGEHDWFPSADHAGSLLAPAPVRHSLARPAKAEPVARVDPPAHVALAASTDPDQDAAGELLLAADAARRAGEPAHAAELLRGMLDAHDRDVRAAVAAFTLGRVLLEDLRQPAEAARAFARSRSLGAGPLDEDALAREVEAYARAGQQDTARVAAREYLDRYPLGRRAGAVRAFGRLP
jgi:transmembrane sensor